MMPAIIDEGGWSTNSRLVNVLWAVAGTLLCVSLGACATGHRLDQALPVVTKVTVPTGVAGSDEPIPVEGAPLRINQRYRMPDYLPGAVDVGFQVGDTPIYTFGSERVFQLASDPDGNNEIVSAFAAADVQLITTPKESMANLDTGSGKYTSVPDLLAALHDLTYLTATPIIDDTSFGPFTARRFDYTVDALSSDYKACPGRPCAATMFADRSTLAMLADETGHFVEIDAGGNEILLHVPNQPAFAGVVSSLHVTVHPSPAAANDATIYVSGRLDAGSYYVRPASAGGDGLVFSTDTPVTGGPRYLDLGTGPAANDRSLLTMIDLSTVLVSKQITLSDDYGTDPADLASQTSPVPDDLLAYLSSLEGIDVVTAPFEQGVGGTSARSMSLRVQPMADGMGSPCDAPGGCGTILVGRKDWGPVGLPAGVVFDVVEIFAGASHFAAILQHGDSEGGKILSTLRFIAP